MDDEFLDELANDLERVRAGNPEANSQEVLADLEQWDDAERVVSSANPDLSPQEVDAAVEFGMNLSSNIGNIIDKVTDIIR